MHYLRQIVIALPVIGTVMSAHAANWMEGLPEVPVKAKPLDKVWATVPEVFIFSEVAAKI